ncbi:MAG: phage tail protein, partial [Alistipes sp.]|nr:phage tail protein [Alistipes sp.]
MIQIYADGVLAYDSRLDEYNLVGLKVTRAVNKGGTAEIVMPPYHPAYSLYTGYRTIVEIYRDGELRFRGRALYPIDDFQNQRTVVCEGELCFLQDAVIRPYLYTTDPASIFKDLVTQYNSQVDEYKRFTIGSITVTDANDYVRLESESAESALAVVNKLIERCGGYIVFSAATSGARVVHWLSSIGTRSSQTIELGENLLNFSRSGANTDLATAIVPYGAKDETTGVRVTIESVNNGKDYIVDETTAAIRGRITRPVVWDDVTEPLNLLTKARKYLNECKLFVTSLTLTALDLSWVDKSIDSYTVGDIIRVKSDAHKLDEDFQLVEQSDDLLHPEQSTICMGKEVRTLTQMDVAGDDKSHSDLNKISVEIKRDIEININKAAAETEQRLTSIIEQQANSIKLEVSGSLGSKAQIKLTTSGGEVKTAELDLAKVRQAFANDKSTVSISGGTITFNSNTLIVNSTNLQVSADGTIT